MVFQSCLPTPWRWLLAAGKYSTNSLFRSYGGSSISVGPWNISRAAYDILWTDDCLEGNLDMFIQCLFFFSCLGMCLAWDNQSGCSSHPEAHLTCSQPYSVACSSLWGVELHGLPLNVCWCPCSAHIWAVMWVRLCSISVASDVARRHNLLEKPRSSGSNTNINFICIGCLRIFFLFLSLSFFSINTKPGRKELCCYFHSFRSYI